MAEAARRNPADEGQPFIATTSARGEHITLRGWCRGRWRARQDSKTRTTETRRTHEKRCECNGRNHNFIFRSFGLREDFFKGHQEAYLSDLVRILQYTGKLFNVYDVLVMALDENVLQEQIGIAKARIASVVGISLQKRLNFEMSVRMLQRSLADRERVEKIQGLLNELLSFLEDELSIVTGSYQDLLTLDDVFEQDLILFVSLNTNRNQRAVEALGKILLQNIQLMVGKRYARAAGERDADEPMLSVILDEFAPFAYPGFTQVLQTARGARVSFLFSFQSLPQLQRVSQAFSDEVPRKTSKKPSPSAPAPATSLPGTVASTTESNSQPS